MSYALIIGLWLPRQAADAEPESVSGAASAVEPIEDVEAVEAVEAVAAQEIIESIETMATTRTVDVLQPLVEGATRFDFYQAMRLIERNSPDKPRFGTAVHPRDEAVRLRQSTEMNFAGSAIEKFERDAGMYSRDDVQVCALTVRFGGLHGSHGPLPLHLTEYIRNTQRHKHDQGAARFLDIFHHRILSLFYRGWAQAQPVVGHERPKDDRFGDYLGSLFGLAETSLQNRDLIPDAAKRHFAGLLASATRPVSGLRQILAAYFKINVCIEQNVGQWSALPISERSRLGTGGHLGRSGRADHAVLGRSALCGQRVWDVQYGVRLILGPLSLSEYLDFLPGSRRFDALRAWLALYLRDPLDIRLTLRLQCDAVPVSSLNARAALGRTCWLGSGDDRARNPLSPLSPRRSDRLMAFPVPVAVPVAVQSPLPVGSARRTPAPGYL